MITGLGRSESTNKFQCINLCVPGTAHVLKSEPNVHDIQILGKSWIQPDGGEGCSGMQKVGDVVDTVDL